MTKVVQNKTRPIRVGLVLFPRCMPAALFATRDLLAAANARSGRPLFDVSWAACDRRPVEVEGGQVLAPDSVVGAHDVYAIPGLWTSRPAAVQETLDGSPLVRRLAALPPTTKLWAWCTGVAWLAASGWLQHRRATATWWLRPLLEARFPTVRWRFDEPLVESRGVSTASGPHGYLPLVSAQLLRHLDADAFDDVREVLVLPLPRNALPMFREAGVMEVDDALRPLAARVLRMPVSALSLETLARSQHVSSRTLRRLIEAHTELRAAEWIRRIKLKQAANALTYTSRSIKEVADAGGYSSESSFSRTFRAELGLTPVEFRRRYGRQG